MSGGRALEGIRVLELGQVMAGPFCALQLCDMGADVIKVEPPDGDPTRQMGARAGTDSMCFAAMNRGKRGIVLDLKSAAGRDTLVRLAAQADVFVENFRPGVMLGLGLDYPRLSAAQRTPDLRLDLRLRPDGPDRTKGGFDLVAQGASGLMSVTGEPGGPPVKVGVPLTDLGAGLFALAAILAALHHRHRSGRGQYIDTSLFEAGLALSAWEAAEFFASGAAPQPMGSAHRFLAPYQAIRCADGYVTIGAGTDRLFADLAALLGHPEWSGMPEFASTSARVRNLAALVEPDRAVTADQPKAHWLAAFEARGIPCGPINTYPEAFADPQVRSRDMVVELDHPTLGRIQSLGSPIKMSDTPPVVGRRAPLLGEHTDEVLREAGFSDEEIRRVLPG
jgi:formyl-CoA transferase